MKNEVYNNPDKKFSKKIVFEVISFGFISFVSLMSVLFLKYMFMIFTFIISLLGVLYIMNFDVKEEKKKVLHIFLTENSFLFKSAIETREVSFDKIREIVIYKNQIYFTIKEKIILETVIIQRPAELLVKTLRNIEKLNVKEI